jgi:putative transcriptional regulator
MTESLRGQFLIAARHLRDSNFYKSVVLIVEHGTDGAMGLVVNRPSSVTVANVLSEHFDLPETDDLLYFGGPAEPSHLFILHNSAQFDQCERPVVPDLFVGSEEVFLSILRSADDGETGLQYRIFSGCAGWGADQLEGELERGDWLVYPADSVPLFCADPYEFWESVLGKVQQLRSILPQDAGNAEWN